MDGVLYFPYINVPQEEWFVRVLLYWEEIGSIVPAPLADDSSGVSPFMAELLRTGLVKAIVPEDYDMHLLDGVEPFLEFIDSDPDVQRATGEPLGLPTTARAGESLPGTLTPIHSGKMGYEIERALVDRRLAERRISGEPWVRVESRTAAAFMAYLAALLGSLPDNQMAPITDRLTNLASFIPHVSEPQETPALVERLRLTVLEGLLPAPSSVIDVHELADFKAEHGHLLRQFRHEVERGVLRVAAIEDQFIRESETKLLKEELSDQLTQVEAKMRARRWPGLAFGALCAFVGGTLSLAGALVTHEPLAAAGTVPTLASAIYSGVMAIHGRKDFEREPLAYAALAQRTLGR